MPVTNLKKTLTGLFIAAFLVTLTLVILSRESIKECFTQNCEISTSTRETIEENPIEIEAKTTEENKHALLTQAPTTESSSPSLLLTPYEIAPSFPKEKEAMEFETIEENAEQALPQITPEEKFTNELHDSLWAVEQEFFYIDFFSSEEELAGFVLSEARCKSTTCKLSFLVVDQNQSDEITNQLVEKLLIQSPSIDITIVPSNKSNQLSLYVAAPAATL